MFEFPKVALAVFNGEKGYREEYQLGKVFFIILLRFCLQRRRKKGKEGQKNRSKWVLFLKLFQRGRRVILTRILFKSKILSSFMHHLWKPFSMMLRVTFSGK